MGALFEERATKERVLHLRECDQSLLLSSQIIFRMLKKTNAFGNRRSRTSASKSSKKHSHQCAKIDFAHYYAVAKY
jgi:hypothetical protein